MSESSAPSVPPLESPSAPKIPSRPGPASSPRSGPSAPPRVSEAAPPETKGPSLPARAPGLPARTPDVPTRSAPARTPAVPARPSRGVPAVPSRSKPSGGPSGGDTVASLEAELQAAIDNQEFEKCGPIRDKINKRKVAEDGAGGGSESLDEDAYNNALARIDSDLQAAISSQAYEKCGPLRDKKKTLETLKGRYDGGDTSVLAELNSKMEEA